MDAKVLKADVAVRYDAVAIAFHWTIALLIIANWPIGYFGEVLEEQVGWNAVPLHKSIGLTVLALSVLRLLWRILHRPPPLPVAVPRLQARAARVAHWGLYVLLIAVPLSGWLRTSAGSYPLVWFGLIEVPKFAIAPRTSEAELAANAHALLGWIMLAFVVAHLSAALYHHVRLRDAVVLRMVPRAWL